MAKTDATKTFSEVLTKLITESGMEYRPLAAAIGISQASLSKYAANDAEPGLTALVKIADYFGVSIDYLAGRTDTKSPNPDLQAAVEFTGLSEQAIKALRTVARRPRTYKLEHLTKPIKSKLDVISQMLTSKELFLQALCEIENMLVADTQRIDDDAEAEEISIGVSEGCRGDLNTGKRIKIPKATSVEVTLIGYKAGNYFAREAERLLSLLVEEMRHAED